MIANSLSVVTTQHLRQIVRRSEKAGLSRIPNAALWKDTDTDGRHVVNTIPLPGEFRFVRTFAKCKLEKGIVPAEVWIDVTAEDWEQLRKEAHE